MQNKQREKRDTKTWIDTQIRQKQWTERPSVWSVRSRELIQFVNMSCGAHPMNNNKINNRFYCPNDLFAISKLILASNRIWIYSENWTFNDDVDDIITSTGIASIPHNENQARIIHSAIYFMNHHRRYITWISLTSIDFDWKIHFSLVSVTAENFGMWTVVVWEWLRKRAGQCRMLTKPNPMPCSFWTGIPKKLKDKHRYDIAEATP